jgi:hypothetical protein
MVDPLIHFKTQASRDQGLMGLHRQIVKLGAILATNLEDILETFGCYQRSASSFSLQESIGGNR